LGRSARSGIILIVGEFISTIISALGIIIIARILGSTSYGVVSIAILPSQIAILFVDFGINQALIQNIAMLRHLGRKGEIRTYIEVSLFFKLFISLVLAFMVYIFADFFATKIYHQAELASLIKVTSLGIIGQAMFSTAVSVFVGYEKMLFRSYIYILFSLLKSLIGPLLVYFGYGPMGAILGRIGPVFIVGVIGLVQILIFLNRIEPDEKITHIQALRSLLIYGMPLFISLLLMNGRSRILDSILPLYVSNEIMGNFMATLNFSVLVSFVSVPLSTSLFPLFSKFDYRKDKELERIFRNAIKYSALLVYPLITNVILLAPHIVNILFSSSYRFTPYFIQLFMLTNFLIGFGTSGIGNLLNSQKETKITMNIKLIQFVFGVSIGVFLIQQMGAQGLFIAKFLTPIPGILYGLSWIKNNFGFRIDWKASAKLLLICSFSFIISYIILTLIEVNNWIELLLGTSLVFMTYIIQIIRFKILTRNDLIKIINMLKIERFTRIILSIYSLFS
jgi:O-antigen/teichoic acid export membrane protein